MLLVSVDPGLRRSHALLFEKSGYCVTETTAALSKPHTSNQFDVVVIDHTLGMSDRLCLIATIRALWPATRIVVLHRSGHLSGSVDLAMDSREGPEIILERVRALIDRPELPPDKPQES